MWDKLLKRDSIAGIAAVLLSAGSFIANIMFEGWTMQLEQWFTPMGIASITLFFGGVGLVV